jgi:mono/diheme cytochrome c family protein
MRLAEKLVLSGLLPLALAACGEQQVSYSQDVQPVFDTHCIECHRADGAGELASGFDMTSYEGLMKGTTFGPMVIAGDPEGSNVLVLMEGRADPSISMPHGGRDPVPDKDIQAIRAWIGQGARNN